jgi:hypoxanthine phosphoribosyltransferase
MVLYTARKIDERVKKLGKDISRDYIGRDLVLVGILKGSLIFLADLLRNIDIPVDLDFICVETYPSGMVPAENSRILYRGCRDIAGRDLLVVEDIVDTGLTLDYIIKTLMEESPNTLEICTLLEKERARDLEIKVKYVGFRIPDVFVVGYGMDCDGKYRGLPFIEILKKESRIDSI